MCFIDFMDLNHFVVVIIALYKKKYIPITYYIIGGVSKTTFILNEQNSVELNP